MTIRRASCLAVCLVAGLAAPSHACPAMFMPPFKLDLGQTWSTSGGRSATGSALLVGLSRATLDPRDVAFDVGLGYVRWSSGDSEDTGAHAARSTISPSIADAHGGYLELAARVQESSHARSWLAVRGELLDVDGDDGAAFGVAARVATELWTGANKRDGGLLAIGSLAVGVYAEVGMRDGGDGRDDVRTFTLGITVRSPFVVIGGGPARPPAPQSE